ncbi:MAG: hypothetical protein OHK0010_30710 [Anaerolineales bacterium]
MRDGVNCQSVKGLDTDFILLDPRLTGKSNVQRKPSGEPDPETLSLQYQTPAQGWPATAQTKSMETGKDIYPCGAR